MSLLNEIDKIVVECQKVVSPNNSFFPTLKLATAAYDYDELGGTGPFNLPLTVPIPKGSFITGIMFDIHTIPTPDTNF